jgi:hypothetical protein
MKPLREAETIAAPSCKLAIDRTGSTARRRAHRRAGAALRRPGRIDADAAREAHITEDALAALGGWRATSPP